MPIIEGWDELCRAVEAILFASGYPVKFSVIADVLSIDEEKVGNAQWQIYRTSDKEGEDLLPVGIVKSGKIVQIPARSIVTLQNK